MRISRLTPRIQFKLIGGKVLVVFQVANEGATNADFWRHWLEQFECLNNSCFFVIDERLKTPKISRW